MLLKISIIRGDSDIAQGDVIIDARGKPQFYDVIILSGRELRSIVAIGTVSEGVPIGLGKYTRKPVAAVVMGRVYIRGIPLTLYEESGLLERELIETLTKTNIATDAVLKKLKELVIAERRKYKRSPTLTLISQYVVGQIDSLPPHIADIVGGLSREELQRLFNRLVEELY
ncbi:conserved hypothetical protein [Pyrobaculum islandicum DSM 4184]|uniref:Uncharacterized protein n=1 Tax=Pyrobaculum islandicum (strain DSM 4184 / JCM 9189 / GEO3) TaxID=384616 RepID=A1RT92_PYRIL|nr:hypothetical protein [Pyrobaculum islandicum]ABL88174.1 conserved hypothetical protein [Pyrobaculum islandicum DSM 4184]